MNGILNTPQQGIGLVEVMVALFLLSIGVLGFSAMQQLAIKATEESTIRTQALSVIRGGAEMMRANPSGIAAFKRAINATASVDNASFEGITLDSCLGMSATCTIEQLAMRDAIAITTQAKQNNLDIAMLTCPMTASITETVDIAISHHYERQCFVVSWGKTIAKLSDTDITACANADGIYKVGVQCFIIESY